MDRILAIDPKHIMAHTNKSLFYMQQGKIEEAEKEKDISFKLSMNVETSKVDELEKWTAQERCILRFLKLTQRMSTPSIN